MRILKIFRAGEWQALVDTGETAGAPIDLVDGYIHFSTPGQVRETAAKYFAGQDGLVLAGLDADALGPDLKWEPARGGALFPHLYGRLALTDIAWHRPLPRDAGGIFQFPDPMP